MRHSASGYASFCNTHLSRRIKTPLMDLEYGTLSIRSSNSFPHELQSLTITLYYKAYLLLKLLPGHFIQMIIILRTIYLDFKEYSFF
jgi:hypothetical protein